ncbi:MAG: DUF4269 domain-containing protein [Pseudomonadota bacterium]
MSKPKPSYETVLDQLQLLRALHEFTPIVIGTPPLGIETLSSDIDVACYSSDFEVFTRVVVGEFKDRDEFQIRMIDSRGEPALLASFVTYGWELELFCQKIPLAHQWGVRHFYIERRLLSLEPRLRAIVTDLKRTGVKTEPAFAQVLALKGDPYEALLSLEFMSDLELRALLLQAVSH